jgi:hypothetical protein
MPREKWKLTRDTVDSFGDPLLVFDDPWADATRPKPGPTISLLELIARDPASGLEQIAPGVYRSTGPDQPPHTSLSGG